MADELERPEETSETHETRIPAPTSRRRRSGRSPSPARVALILVGLIVSMWPVAAIGASSRSSSGSSGSATSTRTSAPIPSLRRPRTAELAVEEDEPDEHDYTRTSSWRARRWARGRDRRRRHAPGPRLRRRFPPSSARSSTRSTSGRSAATRRASGMASFNPEPEERDSVAYRVHPQQRADERRPRASRSSSNRCVHLGCPMQPAGPDRRDEGGRDGAAPVTLIADTALRLRLPLPRRRLRPRGQPHRRPAGARPRPLSYSIMDGNLWLGELYSVAEVEGTGADAVASVRHDPGMHVDGFEPCSTRTSREARPNRRDSSRSSTSR